MERYISTLSCVLNPFSQRERCSLGVSQGAEAAWDCWEIQVGEQNPCDAKRRGAGHPAQPLSACARGKVPFRREPMSPNS